MKTFNMLVCNSTEYRSLDFNLPVRATVTSDQGSNDQHVFTEGTSSIFCQREGTHHLPLDGGSAFACIILIGLLSVALNKLVYQIVSVLDLVEKRSTLLSAEETSRHDKRIECL
jgi:hypothetical protein